MADPFDGPRQIGYAIFPGRGISYTGKYEGHEVQVSFSEKKNRMRIHVDGVEWKPAVGVKNVVINGVTYEPVAERT